MTSKPKPYEFVITSSGLFQLVYRETGTVLNVKKRSDGYWDISYRTKSKPWPNPMPTYSEINENYERLLLQMVVT